MKSLFITGISSGIGKGLALFYADKGIKVYGLSRRELDYKHKNIFHLKLDIDNHNSLDLLTSFIGKEQIDLSILNAGVLGEMSSMKNVSIETLQKTMMTNVWSQKAIIDKLIKLNCTKQIMAISSGAGVKGTLGWSGYSISKAALNMLIQLYANENPNLFFIAFAPGLVDTPMQDYLCESVDTKKFPTITRLKEARGTQAMPKPEVFSQLFNEKLEQVLELESGSFVDIRKL